MLDKGVEVKKLNLVGKEEETLIFEDEHGKEERLKADHCIIEQITSSDDDFFKISFEKHTIVKVEKADV